MATWTKRLLFAVFVCAIGSGFQHGYNTGVVNAPQKILEEFINETQYKRDGIGFTESEVRIVWSVAVAIYCVGGMIGGLCTALVAERLGRKKGLMINNVFAVIGGLLLEIVKVSESYEVLILGRFIVGINSGLNAGLAPMYITEISPVNLRGALGSTYQLVITISILLSQCLGLPQVLGTQKLWPTLFALIIVPAILQVILLVFCPASPRFLYAKTKDVDLTKKVLVWLREEQNVNEEFEQIRMEVEFADSVPKATIGQIIDDPLLRRMMMLSIIIMMSQQFSGINAVIFFSTFIFISAGLNETEALIATLTLGTINVFVTILSLCLVERVGRRSLYLSNLFLLIVIELLLTIVLEIQMGQETTPRELSFTAVGLVVVFIIVFATGLGPIPWFVVNELFDQTTRSLATSIAVFINWTSNFIVSVSFLPVTDIIRGYVFLIFAGCLSCAFFIAFLKMPETKNKNPEEVRAAVERSPWAQYRGQQPTARPEARSTKLNFHLKLPDTKQPLPRLWRNVLGIFGFVFFKSPQVLRRIFTC